jgi:dihydrofolate reductase
MPINRGLVARKVFADIDISLDGFVAGENISPENPLGTGGERLIWYGDDVNDDSADFEGTYGQVDAMVLRNAMGSEGAVIMGRTTFDMSVDSWGDNPPIHKPCFVLTNNGLASVEKPGGTSFTFVTSGPEEAVRLAKGAAGSRGVCVMGGAQTIRGFLERGLLDELRLHIVPILLGKGLRLFDREFEPAVGFEKVLALNGEKAVHLVLRPRGK